MKYFSTLSPRKKKKKWTGWAFRCEKGGKKNEVITNKQRLKSRSQILEPKFFSLCSLCLLERVRPFGIQTQSRDVLKVGTITQRMNCFFRKVPRQLLKLKV